MAGVGALHQVPRRGRRAGLPQQGFDEGPGLVVTLVELQIDLVEPHLAEAAMGFTRLDGTTRDRGAVVREFQDPGGPPILLVSLRAGGTGLNLTAADHVFLLDPWWNPAVEAQAIDRAHRIGQDKHVFAYRLIAKDTVEEKVLELQQTKRELADAIIGQDNATLRNLTREDLDLLLG